MFARENLAKLRGKLKCNFFLYKCTVNLIQMSDLSLTDKNADLMSLT